MPDHQRPSVGIGVYIIHGGKVLLNQRVSAHGAGTWQAVGGHLEYGETWEECAIRECMEETGIAIRDVRFFGVTNDLFPESGKHYITISMEARADSFAFENREPTKYAGFGWYEWGKFPEPLFPAVKNLLAQGIRPGYLDDVQNSGVEASKAA